LPRKRVPISTSANSSINNIPSTSTEEVPVNSLLTVNSGSSESAREGVDSLLRKEDFYTSTDVIGIRLPLVYKIIYKKYIANNKQRLELFKKIVSSIIVGLAKTEHSDIVAMLSSPIHGQIVLNMNVNHIEQKVEQKVDVNIDVSALEEAIEELREMIRLLERTNVAYKPALRNYAKKLREVVARIDDVRKQFSTN